MKLLFLDAYFEPEQVAFTHLEHDLLESLAQAGHDIEIVCPTPTRGISRELADQYRNRKTEMLYSGRVHVTRFFAPREGKNPFVRALRYFWCNLRTYQIGAKAKDVDVVFANSTPPTQGWIAGKVAKRIRASFVYSLQDIFPDSLVNAGMTKEGSAFWRIGRALEDRTYKNADAIIAISEACKKNIRNKGVPGNKVTVIPNWIDTDLIKPILKTDNGLFHEFHIDCDKFNVLYAGNFGSSQGADVVLKAAELLTERSDIQFVIFGGGSEFEAAKRYVKEHGLSNVFIHPLLSQDRIAEVYSMGDVALITCKRGVEKAGMPSKTWSIMACNTPIIASFDDDSELSQMLKSGRMGVCVEPENAKRVAEEIINIYERKESFLFGRAFVEAHFSKTPCVNQYIEIMAGCFNKKALQ